MIVTCCGSIIVLRTSTNRAFRPGNRKRAKPYATAAAETVWPIVLKRATITLFRVKRPNGSSVHSSR